MSTLARTDRSYSLAGISLEVIADDPAVIAATDLRFCQLATTAPAGEPALSFEFTSDVPETPSPDDLGRPVYETPYGTLSYFPEHDLLAGELGGVVLHCEPGKHRAVIAAPTFQASTLYFATHPVTTVALMELMERLGRFSLHAGCLADAAGNGVLVAGTSGAGKSTLTLALARAGMEFLGDDTIFLECVGSDPAQRGGIRVLGFADALGLGSFATARFPELAAMAGGPLAAGFPKRLHRFEQLFGREPLAACVPRAIVFPEVAAEQPSAITPVDPGEALLRLVPDVLVTHEQSTQSHVGAIAELLGQVRCYAVRSGYDLERAAETLRSLL